VIQVKLYQTIRKDGKLFIRGYTADDWGREEFSLVETTPEKAYERLMAMQATINTAHPRRPVRC